MEALQLSTTWLIHNLEEMPEDDHTGANIQHQLRAFSPTIEQFHSISAILRVILEKV